MVQCQAGQPPRNPKIASHSGVPRKQLFRRDWDLLHAQVLETDNLIVRNAAHDDLPELMIEPLLHL